MATTLRLHHRSEIPEALGKVSEHKIITKGSSNEDSMARSCSESCSSTLSKCLSVMSLKNLILSPALIHPVLNVCRRRQLIKFQMVLKKTRSRERPACMGQTATGKAKLQVVYNPIISIACSM